MVTYVMVCFSILLSVGTACAELWVCGDPSTPTSATAFRTYYFADYASTQPPDCSRILNGNTTPQLAVIQSVGSTIKYLKLVGMHPTALVAIKTQAEKDVVDNADAAQQAAIEALRQERLTNIFCNQGDVASGTAMIAARKATLYAQIDALPAASPPSRATLVAALKGVVDEIALLATLEVNCNTARK